MFLAGSVLYIWGDKIKVIPILAIGCICSAVIVQLFLPEFLVQVAPIIFAYGVLALSAVLRVRLGHKNDLSYGVYIYAFPLQQLAVIFGSASIGIIGNIVLVTLLSLGLAFLSWHLVEKQMMKFKAVI